MKTPERDQSGLLRHHLETLFDGAPSEDAAVLKKALNLALRAHAEQTRDDGTAYVLHPLRVTEFLMTEMGVRDPVALCVALLHDVVEDNTAVTSDDIAGACGSRVLELVHALTKPPKQGRTHAEVNAVYFPLIAGHPDETVRLVKLADRLDNVRDLVNCPDELKRSRMLMETETFYCGLIEAMKNRKWRASFSKAYKETIERAKVAFPKN